MPHDITTPVTRNVDLGQGNYLLEFEHAEIAATMKPAQFFMIGIPGAETLLRRPYSVCGLPGTFADAEPDRVQVLYKTVGRGTSLLAALAPGAPITVLGPLGSGFSLPADPQLEPLFVAGGIGSAPFPALAAALRDACGPVHMIYGARSAADLPLLDWFREHTSEVLVTTDDGSAGEKGLVTGPLERMLAAPGASTRYRIFACGPDPMLRAVGRMAQQFATPCELSLEAHMACGFGVCLGCVVPTHGPDGTTDYTRLCVEGPVLPAERMAW